MTSSSASSAPSSPTSASTRAPRTTGRGPPPGVPRAFVRLAQDASLPPALQDRLIREADALAPGDPTRVRTLSGSHLYWLVHPAEAADVLTDLAKG
jgi:hypothetical protein